MVFYRYTGKDDLWLGKYGKSERTLIPNEILTQSELNSIKTKCPRLNINRTFKTIDIPKSKTYSMFGVRFEDGTDHNSKLESKRKTVKKLRIKEDRDYIGNINIEPFRRFEKTDWYAFSGADTFEDGSEPLIAEFADDTITLIVCGNYDNKYSAAINLYYYDDTIDMDYDDCMYNRLYISTDTAINAAKHLCKKLENLNSEDISISEIDKIARNAGLTKFN